jgi:hypothetical protein
MGESDGFDALFQKHMQLAAAAVAAAQALEKYGRHGHDAKQEWCPRHWVDEDCGDDGSACTCGLDDALKDARAIVGR